MFAADRDQKAICALSTPSGTGALAVVRLSGENTLSIGREIAPFLPLSPESHRAYFGRLKSASSGVDFDEALVTYFAKGKSFTGEETLEFSTHGSPIIVQELLRSLVAKGALPADRGEFTYRAFMNGKMDLVQAESVLALIESQSALSSQQALRQLEGTLSEELEYFESEITWALAHIEAGIDFSTEGLETVSALELDRRLMPILSRLKKRLATYQSGRLVKDGLRVVLTGQPNVGKSSLLNAVLGEEKAIVTEIAGTTRDLIEAPLFVNGIRVNFIDTAGLRDSMDVVEKIGIERTQKASQDANLILFVFDAQKGLDSRDLEQLRKLNFERVFLVANKRDQVSNLEKRHRETHEKLQTEGFQPPPQVMFVSALDKLQAQDQILGFLAGWVTSSLIEDQALLFQARHFERLSQAEKNLESGLKLVNQGVSPELAALELKEALLCVQEVLGKFFDDQILDRVFKEFCIGK